MAPVGTATATQELVPAKDAIDNGIRFSLHCDAPLTPMSPLMQVFSGVNRITKSGFVLGAEQRIPVKNALRAITIDAAYLHKEEKIKGSRYQAQTE